jgi:hypothetical protein
VPSAELIIMTVVRYDSCGRGRSRFVRFQLECRTSTLKSVSRWSGAPSGKKTKRFSALMFFGDINQRERLDSPVESRHTKKARG